MVNSIQKTLNERYGSAFWVVAEMSKLNMYTSSGHCYPELLEKRDGRVVAELKATLWKSDYLRIQRNFITQAQEPLKDGIKILFLASVVFDPIYGLSLRIHDIDPSFTLGDLEREKQLTIKRLTEMGLMAKNRTLHLALLPQRIALISVETTDGFVDFTSVLKNNPFGYPFFYHVFSAHLQGDRAVESILKQLEQIEKFKHHFDLVAIVRGGGGDVGLSCYNHFDLASGIANFPLPVITGIGHATNETVSEKVAFYNAITPTKLAEWLVSRCRDFEDSMHKWTKVLESKWLFKLESSRNTLSQLTHQFQIYGERILSIEKEKQNRLFTALPSLSQKRLRSANQSIQNQTLQLASAHKLKHQLFYQNLVQVHMQFHLGVKSHLKTTWLETNEGYLLVKQYFASLLKLENQQLKLSKNRLLEFWNHNVVSTERYFDSTMRWLDQVKPENILKRGFSITLKNGKLTNTADLKPGDSLETLLAGDVRIKSVIEDIQIKP